MYRFVMVALAFQYVGMTEHTKVVFFIHCLCNQTTIYAIKQMTGNDILIDCNSIVFFTKGVALKTTIFHKDMQHVADKFAQRWELKNA